MEFLDGNANLCKEKKRREKVYCQNLTWSMQITVVLRSVTDYKTLQSVYS